MGEEQIEIVAQVIGVFAMIANCLGYQMRKKNSIIFCQLLGSVLFAVNFFMIGAYAGAILNVVAVVRAIIYMNSERTRADHVAWLIGFSVIYLLSYAAVFTIFKKPPTILNLVFELLPVIAMIATTFSFRHKEARVVRAFGMVSSPLWLAYNIYSLSFGAIVCESINIVSIIVGIIRFDLKKKNSAEEKTEN